MKIATYNLRFGGKAGNRVHWQKVIETANPDIFLVQETLPPEHYFPKSLASAFQQQSHWKAVNDRVWGSAVYVRSGQVVPLAPLSPALSGWVTGVKVTGAGWPTIADESLYIYSVHAPSGRSSYVRQVNLILDLIKAQIPADATVVIGGDFNLTVGIRHAGEELQQSQPKLMARFQREFGLMNCWQMAHPNQNLPQTLRWSRDQTQPFHCDGIFTPACWYRFLDDADILDGDDWRKLSDHNPVVASFK